MTKVMVIGSGDSLSAEVTARLRHIGLDIVGGVSVAPVVKETIKNYQFIQEVLRDMEPKPWGNSQPYLKRKKGRR